MIERVISGGQTGADQAGWHAARRFGIETSGWMPKGFLTEDGPLDPEAAALYGAVEHFSSEYPPRTRANVSAADATIWFGDPDSRGGKLTISIVRSQPGKRFCVIRRPDEPLRLVFEVAEWFKWMRDVKVLNVAGNRESSAPGIGALVEEYLCEVFRLLGHKEAS